MHYYILCCLSEGIEKLIDQLKLTIQSKVKANAVKQEHEKQEELKRSALRAVAALLTIPDSDKSVVLSEFISQIKGNQETAALFESVQNDSASGGIEAMEVK